MAWTLSTHDREVKMWEDQLPPLNRKRAEAVRNAKTSQAARNQIHEIDDTIRKVTASLNNAKRSRAQYIAANRK